MIGEKNIADRLELLRKYTGYLRDYRKHSLHDLERDPMLRGAVERYFQLSIERVIDICEIIISSLKLRKPEEYRQAIDILGEQGILPQEFAHRLAPIAGFRNILVHEYGQIDLKKVHEHLQDHVDDFETFAAYIVDFLHSNRASVE